MARKIDDSGAVAAATFNMTPMIDVCFQLIVVFLCSMKFRTLDEKIEAFLPETGMDSTKIVQREEEPRAELRLVRKPGDPATRLRLLDNPVGAAGEDAWALLEGRLRSLGARDARLKVEIDADPDVPHGDVVRALDACMAASLTNVVFPGTGSPPRRGR